MHYRSIVLLVLFSGLAVSFFTSCTTRQYFMVDSASYQPAVFDETNRITTIEVVVSNVDTNVVFTDIVFQNLRIPVITENLTENQVKISGYIQVGGKLAEDHYQILTEENNKLIFMVEKNRRSIPLENVERQKTQMP